jgi:soluble lytic murein transglycosylase
MPFRSPTAVRLSASVPTRSSNARRGALALLAAVLPWLGAAHAGSSPTPQDPVVEAAEALRKKDAPRLAQLRALTAAQQHPLALWVDYWELGNRLAEAQQPELDAFYARWSGTYVEDRLRNDWLLELGKRGDWANFTREFPRFRMNDDREVTCYTLLAEHAAMTEGTERAADLRARALDTWLAQRDLDDGCSQMATALAEARVLTPADIWLKVRSATEAGKAKAARAAAALVVPALQVQVARAFDNPALYLNAGATVGTRANSEITALALSRMASNDADMAAKQLRERWEKRLPVDLAAWAWAQIGRHAALKLSPEASAYYANAWGVAERGNLVPAWSDDVLAWDARAALRSGAGAERWRLVLRAIDHMSAAEQREPAWRYWRARALRETAAPGTAGERQLAQALAVLDQLAGRLHFYGILAADDLDQPVPLPPLPAPLTAEERAAADAHPGLARALQLIALGLRNEGVREWNFSLRGMNDRALRAAAARACEQEVWDRCINTSERARSEIDLAQRYPMPYRSEVLAKSAELGLDPAYVYGLIRQESRFIADARSSVGASGLMQLMPTTARWTAKKIGVAFSAETITDRDVNLKIGTGYLRLVLDDFDGSELMAAAAYNAGPNRSRHWREGAPLEPAIWAENIPFNETRDYVKKVLSNATVYAALLAGRGQVAPPLPVPASAQPPAAAASPAAHAQLPSLKARLGAPIGPRQSSAPPNSADLP